MYDRSLMISFYRKKIIFELLTLFNPELSCLARVIACKPAWSSRQKNYCLTRPNVQAWVKVTSFNSWARIVDFSFGACIYFYTIVWQSSNYPLDTVPAWKFFFFIFKKSSVTVTFSILLFITCLTVFQSNVIIPLVKSSSSSEICKSGQPW